jgi:diguanylate cyclase (GGDEF)-like protein
VENEVSTEDSREQVTSHLVPKLLNVMVILVVGTLPLSLLKIPAIGFRDSMAIHAAVCVFTVAIFLFRRFLSYSFIGNAILATLVIASVATLADNGLTGNGLMLFSVASFVMVSLHGVRQLMILAAAYLVFSSIIAFAFINGYLVMPMSANTMHQSPSVWISTIFFTAVATTMFALAVNSVKDSLLRLNNRIEKQKEEITRLANQDSLTGLPSLRVANENLRIAIALAKRNDYQVGVLMIDLDDFKDVNDSHGHEAGDYVLKTIAERLPEILRTSDTACRIGGDEFLVILSRVVTVKETELVCQRVIDAISTPIKYGATQLRVGASVGCAFYPNHGETVAELRRAADLVMYDAKQMGKNNYVFAAL